MDEILASIRKIIADEPGQARPPFDRRAANPLIEPETRAKGTAQADPPDDGRPLPPTDRFGDSLRLGAGPAAKGFDDDLEDLLEGPSPATATASPSRPSPLPGNSAFSTATPVAPASTSSNFDAPAKDAPASTMTAIAAALGGSEATKSERGNGDTANAKPPRVTGAPDFSAIFPSASTVSAAKPAAKSTDPEPTGPVVVPVTPAEATHQAAAIAKGPGSSATGSQGAGSPPARHDASSGASLPSSAASFPFDPVEQAPVSSGSPDPVAQGATPRTAANAGSVLQSLDRESQAAAASALGALAAGLAASSAANEAVRSAPVASSAAPSMQAAPSATAPGAAPLTPQRTLEDIVTDMVRPMLEKWIAENMPRIMEKALRGEVMGASKPGPKV